MESLESQYVFAVCQRGMDAALKAEFEIAAPNLRPAFSRSGFVTFKSDEPISLADHFIESCFARTQGLNLGNLKGENLSELVDQLWKLDTVASLVGANAIQDIHIFERDTATPGWRGFVPGQTPLAIEVERAIRKASPLEALQTEPRVPVEPSPVNATILDVVLVEPNSLWIGCHVANRWIARWPGGVIPVAVPDYAASRAYGKIAEAIDWSKIPLAEGDTVLEIGCAPGGAVQALLDIGMRVIGIDPAEVDPSLLDREGFVHLRKRSSEVRKKEVRGVRWIVSDMNVAPKYTLDAVEDFVTNEMLHIRGLILTLKLTDLKLARELPEYVARIQSWGFQDVRLRQLALAGQELTVVALKSKSQRRIYRG